MLKVFSAAQIRDIDAYTIRHEPIGSLALMERAASECTRWIVNHIPKDRPIVVFAGPGNNGGDGLALTRQLLKIGYQVSVYILQTGKHSPDFISNRERLEAKGLQKVNLLCDSGDFPVLSGNALVVDALFGSGLTRPLEGLSAMLVEWINKANLEVLSIDIPSGLSPDGIPSPGDPVIRAARTLSFQFPKLAFFLEGNHEFTGNWDVLDIGLHPDAIRDTVTPYFLIEPTDVFIPPRDAFSHKGVFGHALLCAGSQGKMGAAILASKACLRTGVGLLTTATPVAGRDIIQVAVPEAMCFAQGLQTHCLESFPEVKGFNAVGVGPGIGQEEPVIKMFGHLIESCRDKPLLVDADGINILASHPEWMSILPSDTVITPHPGEFRRLAGDSANSIDGLLLAREFAREHRLVLVLKGAYTRVISPSGDCFFNPTGNPGMATAGSGDVLSGIILSLLAQGLKPLNAAISGVYLHGLSGDLATAEGSMESLIAGDLVTYLGAAFRVIHKK
jgi:ADP-dependent NAD(P)H-hydrate dehydratase / NAD(P)H-hydrate epimerase